MSAVDAAALLVNTAGVGRLLSISRATVFGLLASGPLPSPALRCRRVLRWDTAKLQAWVAAGCPSRDRWYTVKGGRP